MKLLKNDQSQLGQASFVAGVLNLEEHKRDLSRCCERTHWYVEIGAFHATDISNTYILEREFDFTGLSIELSEELQNSWNLVRQNKLIIGDATKISFQKLFHTYGFPKVIDYLSVDIDPPFNTLIALLRCVKKSRSQGVSFKVITFEHDLYLKKYNFIFKLLAFIVLTSKGYSRIVNNVSNEIGKPQEDWYVHKSVSHRAKSAKDISFREYFSVV